MERLTVLEGLVKRQTKKDLVAHDYAHFLRVRNIALKIAIKEGANREIVQAAALIHDLAREEDSESDKYYIKSAELGRKLLIKAGYDEKFIDVAVECAKSHSRSSLVGPKTLEAKVIFDADKIDGLGYVGVARWYLTMGRMGINLEQSTRKYIDTLTRSYDQLNGKLFTKTGSEIAIRKYAFCKKFAQKILEEIDCNQVEK